MLHIQDFKVGLKFVLSFGYCDILSLLNLKMKKAIEST